ncbi:MAG TPA: Holliday junction resolvase RuvX [Acidimicrobiales bacterium]
MTRAVALDIGTRRIGVALSDSAGTLATPYEVVPRSGDRARDHDRIAALADDADAEVVVVGLPLSLDGTVGPAARTVLDEVAELRARLGRPVVVWDERLSTAEAERRLRGAGVKGRARRKVVDQVAATVILQAWLDAGQPLDRPDPGGPSGGSLEGPAPAGEPSGSPEGPEPDIPPPGAGR